MWAQMIRLGKHESTDDPPDKPFWRERKRKQDVPYSSSSTKRAQLDVSPSKKVSVRSELLDQLLVNGIILVSVVLCLTKSTKSSRRKFFQILNNCHD